MYVIGTAGHVDHGKSTLVRALTGIDPDRLREEKERGLTIDLGFAWLTLPSGREVSIVDVPGHERFIKNMLAGAGGIDLALLVVAADEGPMPQTREHLAILDLLDVPGGIVVITKTDAVEPDYVDLVEAELEETLAGSRLEHAPRVRVSAATGEGLDRLLAAIDAALETTPAKRDLGRPRLPIDRAFTIQGFGVVVTGTLVDGAFEVGQEVELAPAGLRARIRGLQRHKTKVTRLEPGTRAAINLSGIRSEDVERGMVLALPGTLPGAHAVDVRLRATGILSHPLSHDAGVTFLSATAESEAKLRLLDVDEVGRAEEAWAQLVLDTPVAVSRGDHCVVRTSNETVAGGVIVAVNPRRHRRKHAATIDALERQLAGSDEERLVELLMRAPLPASGVAAALGLEADVAARAAKSALAAGIVISAGGRLLARAWVDNAISRAAAAVDDFLAANSLRAAAPREHVRSALRLDGPLFDIVVREAAAAGAFEERGPGLARPGYAASLSARQQQEADAFVASLRAGRYSPPTDRIPDPPLLAYLAERGLVEDTGAGVVFDPGVFREMVAKVAAHIEANGSISLAEVRDLFGNSRKYAQAFLEHLDATKVTRRVGDARVLRGRAEVAG
ncbi:MAG: selenocysteine-specific translation elongation factor [Chloroflexi bacterium]|nr:selenocysteine-specific translation elongation factor [Chloroflexota bacterium]